VLGEQGGEQAHTLSTSEIPSHKHGLNGVLDRSNTNAPGGAYLAGKANTYGAAANSTTMAAGEIANVGGSQPHQNMQPYLVMNFCIALQGIFPSPN
jgi:microcystin-dependent protein